MSVIANQLITMHLSNQWTRSGKPENDLTRFLRTACGIRERELIAELMDLFVDKVRTPNTTVSVRRADQLLPNGRLFDRRPFVLPA